MNDVTLARSKRRRPRLLGVAAVLVLASCGGSGGEGSSTIGAPDTSGPVSVIDSVPGTTADTVPVSASTPTSPDTAAPEGSAPATTDPGPGSPASWSVVASDDAFEPACADRSPVGAVTTDDDPALDTLQPLGAEPVVQVELPRAVGGQGRNDWIRSGVQRIPGGMLLALRPHDSWADAPGVLLAVDADGSIRWQRCLQPMPEVVLVSDRGDPSEFVLARSVYDGAGVVDTHLEVWSLADGSRARSWNEQLRAQGITGPAAAHRSIIWSGERSLLVLGAGEPRPVEPADTVLVLDLETMAMRAVAYPPTELGLPLDSVRFGVTDDARLTTLGVDDSTGREFVRAVEVPGGWSIDAAALAAVTGPDVRFAWEVTDQPLVGVDAQGVERWRRDDVLAIRAEGFMVEVVGNVALASACSEPPAGDDFCPGPKLLAVDVTTGRTLWQRDGRWGVSVIGDRRAMISGPYAFVSDGVLPPSPPWFMIDLATGEQVGATTWTEPWSFGIGCCDSPEGAWAAGGVVFTVDEATVEMWYPDVVSTPLRRLSLAD